MEPNLVTPDYELIDIDQMEPSIVRRRLRRWTEADEGSITPLVAGLQNKGALSGIQIQKPRYETNVYPLYYYWAHTKGLPHTQVYSRIVESFHTYTDTAPENSLILQHSTYRRHRNRHPDRGSRILRFCGGKERA